MDCDVTVIGAGPVGLAAALFLHARGGRVRVFERLERPTRYSKALAVNPRTLELLDGVGVTEKMLALGRRIHGAEIYDDDDRSDGRSDGHDHTKSIANISLDDLHSRYPFMLALSQAVTERLLAEALIARGVKVERGVGVQGFADSTDGVEVTLDDGRRLRSEYLLAADGAHGETRERLGVGFDGDSLPAPFYLADVALETDLNPSHAHVFFLEKGGFYFTLPVIEDDRHPPTGSPLWRLISDSERILSDFKWGRVAAPPVWSSKFQVHHRICRSLSKGRVFLAGDAAHLHSPVGARGMNLGIEDAWVFAKLNQDGRLGEYDQMRRPVDRAVVRKVDVFTRLALGDRAYLRALRKFLVPELLSLSPIRNTMKRALTGLDHRI